MVCCLCQMLHAEMMLHVVVVYRGHSDVLVVVADVTDSDVLVVVADVTDSDVLVVVADVTDMYRLPIDIS